MDLSTSARRAAELIGAADGLLITAGAGMGVDSGLPDFRGTTGFWQAYPALGQARIRFEEIANPAAFARDPRLAWGFYGHRLALYRATRPHAGFSLLRHMADQLPAGAFVFTSNVDGQFQRAGFPAQAVCEVHGSIHHLQCSRPCSDRIWSAEALQPRVDEVRCHWLDELPLCPHCGQLARPNILMFGDWAWLDHRTAEQEHRLQRWLGQTRRPVIIELGAGTAVPTVRITGERLAAPMIRINPREPDTSSRRDIALPCGALAGLTAIAKALAQAGWPFPPDTSSHL